MQDIETLCILGGHQLTNEQKDVVENINNSMLVMANPGTGKTTTLRYALVMAIRKFNIEPERILCLTYTKAAERELHEKYSDLCKKLGIRDGVNCSTFNSFCYKILKATMPELKTQKEMDTLEMLKGITNTLKLKISKDSLRQLNSCINYTSRHFITDETDLMNCSMYTKMILDTGLTYTDYINILKSIFNTKLFRQEILEADQPEFALWGLVNNVKFTEELRHKYDLVIVDEFQDMNFLYLVLLSKVAEKLVAIGDIKQQIYRFNGSADNIITLYNKMYPEALHKELTQSFRCSDNIAAYASNIIRYNNYKGFSSFRGNGKNGNIKLLNIQVFNDTLEDLVEDIKKDNDFHNHLFLYRYQLTGMILIDKLFDTKIPMRIDYIPLYKQELFRDAHKIFMCAKNPEDFEAWRSLYAVTIFHNPKGKERIIEEAIQMGESMYTVKAFMSEVERDFIRDMLVIKTANDNGYSAEQILNLCGKIIKNYFKDTLYPQRLTYKYTYYLNIVQILSRGKTWSEMIDREIQKEVAINQSNSLNYGVRFKTLHSSKGLESKNVYILDYDVDAMPNMKKLNVLLNEDFIQEACEKVRDERCLAFVGVTRAMENLQLIYNLEPSKFHHCNELINEFEELDNKYIEKVQDSVWINGELIKPDIHTKLSASTNTKELSATDELDILPAKINWDI